LTFDLESIAFPWAGADSLAALSSTYAKSLPNSVVNQNMIGGVSIETRDQPSSVFADQLPTIRRGADGLS